MISIIGLTTIFKAHNISAEHLYASILKKNRLFKTHVSFM